MNRSIRLGRRFLGRGRAESDSTTNAQKQDENATLRKGTKPLVKEIWVNLNVGVNNKLSICK